MKVNELKITYIEKSHQELSDVEQRLLKEATQAAQKAYAPYSHFRVGAAVKLANGEILSGSNRRMPPIRRDFAPSGWLYIMQMPDTHNRPSKHCL